jgi:hypothetical protein
MPRNVLKNATDTLCRMFCGWRQLSSKNRLVERGSGVLEIDVLTGECFFDEKQIPKLPIATELQLSLQRLLTANHIREPILRARLRVKLSFCRINWEERKNAVEKFYVNGEIIHSTQMHQCKFQCEAEVCQGARIIRSEYEETEEWPIGWPSDLDSPSNADASYR